MEEEVKNRIVAFLDELAELTDKYGIMITEQYYCPNLSDVKSGKYIAWDLCYDCDNKVYTTNQTLKTEV